MWGFNVWLFLGNNKREKKNQALQCDVEQFLKDIKEIFWKKEIWFSCCLSPFSIFVNWKSLGFHLTVGKKNKQFENIKWRALWILSTWTFYRNSYLIDWLVNRPFSQKTFFTHHNKARVNNNINDGWIPLSGFSFRVSSTFTQVLNSSTILSACSSLEYFCVYATSYFHCATCIFYSTTPIWQL